MKYPFISVIIATLNRTDYAVRCIESVLSGEYKDFEIIIVDQGKDGKTKKEVTERFGGDKRVRYFHTDVVGPSHARNLGYEAARGEILAYIDDDALATYGWLKAYANAFTELKPMPAMVGGKILPVWEIPCPEWYPEERRFILGIYDAGDEPREFPGHDLPITANFAMQRRIIEELGGFDRRLGFGEGRRNSLMTGEDSLMAIKVKDTNYTVYYYPEAKVYHHIAGYKLTKKYFLRRHYWEGITAVNIQALRGRLNIRRLLGMLLWHMLAVLKNGIAWALSLLKADTDAGSRKMLNLGYMFYSLGICRESLNFFLRRRGF